MTDITPTDEQAKAIKSIVDWYGEKGRQEFYLAGYAGVGKSTIASRMNCRVGHSSHSPVAASALCAR